MSAEFPSLGVIVRKHRIERCSVSNTNNSNSYQWGRCVGCDFVSYTFPIKGINWDVLALEITADHIAEVWREACTVTTVEQMQALPLGSVIRTELGGVLEKYADKHWRPTGGSRPLPCGRWEDALGISGARVIHNPDWETK